MTHEFMKTFQN